MKTYFLVFELEEERDVLMRLFEAFGVTSRGISKKEMPAKIQDELGEENFYLSVDLTDEQIESLDELNETYGLWTSYDGDEPSDDESSPEPSDEPSDEPRA